MSGTTISSADTVGIVLTAASQSPLTIAATGSVYVVGYYGSGIYSGIDAPATIVNLGAVYGAGYGVNLHDGGTITNGSAAQTSASLTGGYEGVLVGARGPAAITNFGTIASTNRTSGIGIMAGGAATVGNGAATVGNGEQNMLRISRERRRGRRTPRRPTPGDPPRPPPRHAHTDSRPSRASRPTDRLWYSPISPISALGSRVPELL